MSSLLYTEYSRKWQSRISMVFFNYMCTHTSLVKHIFFHIIYTVYIVFNVISPSVAWNTSHLIAFYNSKLQFDSVIIYIQYKHFFYTDYQLHTCLLSIQTSNYHYNCPSPCHIFLGLRKSCCKSPYSYIHNSPQNKLPKQT